MGWANGLQGSLWHAQHPLRSQTTWLWLWGLGPITPFGGLLLMAGWLTLAICAWRQRPAH
ncbi:hypothetical protein [Chromohalobacter israelensis]|uniref:hypothetical protein n=1 Tax=Chromohalobacter israelensis TaxID=141390 RepID=UPI000A05D1FB|nr:hypothetical protein [Chromohalobacter salexigens]MDO0945658.1 hypothetical protein [Chromohalobacter salexigens]